MSNKSMTVAEASEEAGRLGVSLEVLLKVAFARVTDDLIRLHPQREG